MPFLDHVLQSPIYGWKDTNDNLIKPTNGEIYRAKLNEVIIILIYKGGLVMGVLKHIKNE
ncbi:hypothetical protein [Mucilaginibacter sp. UR6-11]|uniref:hypothetical protein n=1 Tax=Mucilaginibacter sp. UR6-11 TaxID=1435644 RepID=UPI001E474903|nr:hypothetical protein [Mucilaginibacter sp. UR6-11]MCC8425000.1 hypothetical protein [Mucilaginibacter sp. UR6-11]